MQTSFGSGRGADPENKLMRPMFPFAARDVKKSKATATLYFAGDLQTRFS
jgi:hypothetical protein